VAAKCQLPIQTTGDFTRSQPDPALATTPQLTETAFQLTPQAPTSDALQSGDGFYVLHLAGIEEAKPLTLEEARPQIVETLKQQQTRTLVASRGAQAAQEVREALKNNQPLEPIAAKTRLQLERMPPFALADAPAAPGAEAQPAESPDLPMIKRAVAELNPGDVSEFIPTPTGGLVAILEKREPPDAATAEEGRKTYADRYLKTKRELAFYEWLREARRAAGVPESKEPAAMTMPLPG
jgi:parvulin-like peptidyl-prolyl isomerase